MSKTTVRTGRGKLEVVRRVNAAGQITGRVTSTKTTYKGDTWPEVEKKIKDDNGLVPELKPWIAIGTEDPSRESHQSGVTSYGLKLESWGGGISEPCPDTGFTYYRNYHRGDPRTTKNPHPNEILGVRFFDRDGTAVPETPKRAETVAKWMEEIQTMQSALTTALTQPREFVAAQLDAGIGLHELIALGINLQPPKPEDDEDDEDDETW